MNSSVNPSCDIVFILCWKKMKVQPHIPFMDLLSWVSLYGFPEKNIYLHLRKSSFSKYRIFENGFDISFKVLAFHKTDLAKQGTRLKDF